MMIPHKWTPMKNDIPDLVAIQNATEAMQRKALMTHAKQAAEALYNAGYLYLGVKGCPKPIEGAIAIIERAHRLPAIDAATAELARERDRYREALLAITIEGDGTNEHGIASEALERVRSREGTTPKPYSARGSGSA
jgi:hypothetical protein